MPPKPIRRPTPTMVKMVDYEELRTFVARRHRIDDDAEFWSHVTGGAGDDRYVAVDLEEVLRRGSGAAADFAGVLQKEYRDTVLILDLQKRRRAMGVSATAAMRPTPLPVSTGTIITATVKDARWCEEHGSSCPDHGDTR